MAFEELSSFESVYGRTDGRSDAQPDRRTDDGQKVIIIAHPEHSSGEPEYDIVCRLNDIFLFKFPLYFFQNGKIKMSSKRHIISFKRHNLYFHFHSTFIV